MPGPMTGPQCRYSRWTGGREGWTGWRESMSHDGELEGERERERERERD